MSRIARHMLSQNIHGSYPWSVPLGLLPEDPPGGGGGEGGTGGAGDGGTGGTGGDPPGEKQLPQSKVNEIVAQRTAEAKNEALAALAKELGVTIDEAKAIVKERKEADERNQTELEKERNRAAAAEKDRDEKTSASATELHAERSDRALVSAGVPDEDAKLERLRGMLTVKVGASKDDIRKDVEKLKAEWPALFDGTPSKGGPPGSDPKSKPGGGKVTDGAFDRGSERAKQAYTQTDSVPRPAIPGVPVQT